MYANGIVLLFTFGKTVSLSPRHYRHAFLLLEVSQDSMGRGLRSMTG